MKSTRIFCFCLLFVLFAGVLSSCGKPGVRKSADKHDLRFGSAIQPGDVFDKKAVSIIKENFNVIVPFNTMKWEVVRPSRNFWNWNDIDKLVDFTQKNNLQLRWHTLTWYKQIPGYVNTVQKKEDLAALLENQITTIVTRYKGKICEYDVVNEVIDDNGEMRDTMWRRMFGDEFIDMAFNFAHKADPDAKLIMLDYNNEYMGTPKGDKFYEVVKGLVERKVPITGVGFQLHLIGDVPVNEEALRNNIKRFVALGLEVAFTEIDVRLKDPLTPEKEKIQVGIYETLMDIALTEPGVTSYVMWGFDDKQSWVPREFPGYGSAHIFDRNLDPKPAYYAVIARLKQK